MIARSIFDWKGQPSASGADLMRGRIAPSREVAPSESISNAKRNVTTKLLHELRPARQGNI